MDSQLAKAIINKLGATGTPPEFGIEAFTIGLGRYLQVIEEEYLKGILPYNLSSFKLITGNYGGGKTHFLYSIRNLAFRHNYCVAYVGLNPTECPFDKLELVYRAVAANISAPHPLDRPLPVWDKGIESVIRRWVEVWRGEADRREVLSRRVEELPATESTSYSNAVKGAFLALLAGENEGFNHLIQWLKGEDVAKELRAQYRISERIDKATAFRMLRSLIQWIHEIGYTGLIFLFDEAERGMSISSSRDKRRALDNLRQIIDECGNARLPGAMFFYAIPDENLLLEGSGGVYEALKQRLRSSFSQSNPVGVRINLENLGVEPVDFLMQLGTKLAEIFETAYACVLPKEPRERVVRTLAQRAVQAFVFDISYRRLFVVAAIEAFHRLRSQPDMVIDDREADRLLRVTGQRLSQKEQEQVESEEF